MGILTPKTAVRVILQQPEKSLEAGALRLGSVGFPFTSGLLPIYLPDVFGFDVFGFGHRVVCCLGGVPPAGPYFVDR